MEAPAASDVDVDLAPEPVELSTMRDIPYIRPPVHEQTFVPRLF